jgi:hypothetical protein
MRTVIPFRLVGGDQPLVVIAARFNGSAPIDCALETGASHAMLLPEIGARLGVKVEETRSRPRWHDAAMRARPACPA